MDCDLREFYSIRSPYSDGCDCHGHGGVYAGCDRRNLAQRAFERADRCVGSRQPAWMLVLCLSCDVYVVGCARLRGDVDLYYHLVGSSVVFLR